MTHASRPLKQVLVTANKTLTAADQGIKQVVAADGLVITMPATGAGLTFDIEIGGVPAGATVGSGSDGTVGLTIAPGTDDQFIGNGFTAADNKDIEYAKATSHVGDKLRLVGNGTTGWNIVEVAGTWTREA